MFCSNCGTQIADDSRFCSKCGKQVNTSATPNPGPSPSASPKSAAVSQGMPASPALGAVQLKCPSCGAPLSNDRSRCEFCGAELLLVQNGSAFQLKDALSCPKCGRPMGSEAWFCVKCGYVVPEDRELVRQMQKKQAFLKDDVKRNPPEVGKILGPILEPGEFLYYAVTISKKSHYVVTEKRILLTTKKGLVQIPLGEVVAIGDVEPWSTWGNLIGYQFDIQTFKERLTVQFPEGAMNLLFRLQSEVQAALVLHNSGERDVRAVILTLNVPPT